MEYGVPRSGDDLTQQQLWNTHQYLFVSINRVLQVKKRLEQLRFPESDPLYTRVIAAYCALWELKRHLHDESTRKDRAPAGRPPRK